MPTTFAGASGVCSCGTNCPKLLPSRDSIGQGGLDIHWRLVGMLAGKLRYFQCQTLYEVVVSPIFRDPQNELELGKEKATNKETGKL